VQSFLTPQTARTVSIHAGEFPHRLFQHGTFRLFFNSVQYATGTSLFALGLARAGLDE